MRGVRWSGQHICARCLRARAQFAKPRGYSKVHTASNAASPPATSEHGAGKQHNEGALSRRLEQLSEESLESGGKSAQKAVEDAGFSDDLRRRLQEKIADASFRSDNASALAEATLPSSAGRGTRDVAAARPWTGTENVEDTALRMLTDSHKPLRSPSRVSGLPLPAKVDTGRSSKTGGRGVRLASARDRSSHYSFLKDPNLSAEERDKLRAEMKARFQPGARSVPASIKGLASLANERIEDAIARGQFKNIPRGQKIERDYNASSPFIDTTEYFMNKMIQKQEIVPPWIEKQQELVATASRFRRRLRTDWRRHVSRSIASRGGPLEQQLNLAKEYAYAEIYANPPKQQIERLNAVDDGGHLSQITLAGELRSQPTNGDATDLEFKMLEQKFDDDGNLRSPEQQVVVTAALPESVVHVDTQRRPAVPPFRDPQWEETERSYLKTAVDNLNSLTRSYNLMAPDLAKKPYFSLDRELKAAYADVAPTVADAIRERALAPKIRGVEVIGHTPGGVLEKFAMDRAAHVHDDRKPQYGFREFWRDLFA
ncbi:hypothetical protein BAUCODRAFT_40846, partial [Baudoinia panamericana UAMH 10762]